MSFMVSIPYRLNEIAIQIAQTTEITTFQFLIGSMKCDKADGIRDIVAVSIPYRLNEIKDNE